MESVGRWCWVVTVVAEDGGWRTGKLRLLQTASGREKGRTGGRGFRGGHSGKSERTLTAKMQSKLQRNWDNGRGLYDGGGAEQWADEKRTWSVSKGSCAALPARELCFDNPHAGRTGRR